MNKTLYTIGYTGADVEALKTFVEVNNLVIVDARIKPTSRAAQWRKGALENRFGARYRSVVNFGNVNYKGGPIEIVDLETGIAETDYILRKCDGIVLMCMCKDLDICHRKIVAEALEQHLGVSAVHLGKDDLEADDSYVQARLL